MKRKYCSSSYRLIWQGAWDSNPNFTDFRPRTMFPQPSFSRCGLDYVFTLPFGLGSWYIVSTHLGITSIQHGVALTFHRFSQLLLLSFPTRHSRLQSVKEKVRSLFLLEYRPLYITSDIKSNVFFFFLSQPYELIIAYFFLFVKMVFSKIKRRFFGAIFFRSPKTGFLFALLRTQH